MCEPTTIAMLAIAAVSAVSSISAQKHQVNVQNDRNKQQYNDTMTAYRGNLANIEVQRNQAAQNASEQINANNKAAMKAQAAATVSAGESGVAGGSVGALLQELGGMAGMDNTNVEANYLRQSDALNVQRENVYNSSVSQINSLTTPAMPDYLGAALKIGSAGLGAYQQDQRTKAITSGLKTG